MKRTKPRLTRLRVKPRISHRYALKSMASLSAAVAITFWLAACSALPKPGAKSNSVTAQVSGESHKTLTGAELYAVHCNRCHPERYGPERTEAQWTTILLHMRTRANLPAEQARTILKYLQEGSGS